MGFIEIHKAERMPTVLINTHMLMAARDAGVERFFFSSSACVYATEKQTSADGLPLREQDEGMRAILFQHHFDTALFYRAVGLNVPYLLLGAAVFLTVFRGARERGLLLQSGE